jgi:hypothetical protein
LENLQRELSDNITQTAWLNKKHHHLQREITSLQQQEAPHTFTRIERACMATAIPNLHMDAINESTASKIENNEPELHLLLYRYKKI